MRFRALGRLSRFLLGVVILIAGFGLQPAQASAQWTVQLGLSVHKIAVAPLICGCPGTFKKYQVVYGQADLVAATLKETYRGSWIRIDLLGAKGILVYGSPSDQDEIAKWIAPYQIGCHLR